MPRKTQDARLATRHWGDVILGAVLVAGFAGRALCAEPSRPDLSSAASVSNQPGVDSEPAPRSVQAQALVPPSVQDVSPPPAATRWYGYQIMLSDAASLALLFGGGQWGAVAFYASAPPVIHVLNKRYELAVVSPLMRLALPALGVLIATHLQSCGEQEFLCPLGGAIAGLAIGTAVAMIVDWSLAWAPVSAARSSPSQSVAEQHARPARRPRISLTSAGLVPTNDGARLVLGGRF
jgi:hypothetical protein